MTYKHKINDIIVPLKTIEYLIYKMKRIFGNTTDEWHWEMKIIRKSMSCMAIVCEKGFRGVDFQQIHVGNPIRLTYSFPFAFLPSALQVNKYMQITLEFYFSFFVFFSLSWCCWAAHRFYVPCRTRSNFGRFLFVCRLKILEICQKGVTCRAGSESHATGCTHWKWVKWRQYRIAWSKILQCAMLR